MRVPNHHPTEGEIEALRPVRYPVRSGDQFFFMHIPKTAGTTMIEILKQLFTQEEFYSVESSQNLPEVLAPIQSARMVRGHRTYSFLQYFARRPIVLTLLRHPQKRMLSNYSFLGRINQERMQKMGRRVRGDEDESRAATFEEFAATPDMRNMQTQYLSGIRPRSLQEEAELAPVMLEVAKLHLEWIAFFGLVERFDESLALMRYTFNWRKIKEVEAQNVAPSGSKTPLTESVQAALDDATELDMALYDYAVMLFNQRMEQMTRGL